MHFYNLMQNLFFLIKHIKHGGFNSDEKKNCIYNSTIIKNHMYARSPREYYLFFNYAII